MLREMLKHWADRYTNVVVADAGLLALPARERLSAVAKMVIKRRLASLDPAFTNWAKLDTEVARVVQDVVTLRLNFISNMIAELGYRGGVLETKAAAYVVFISSLANMFPGRSEDSLLELAEAFIADLLGEGAGSERI